MPYFYAKICQNMHNICSKGSLELFGTKTIVAEIKGCHFKLDPHRLQIGSLELVIWTFSQIEQVWQPPITFVKKCNMTEGQSTYHLKIWSSALGECQKTLNQSRTQNPDSKVLYGFENHSRFLPNWSKGLDTCLNLESLVNNSRHISCYRNHPF